MRIAWQAALVSIVLASALLGSASGASSGDNALKVAQVDLQAALDYESMALASAEAGNLKKAREQIHEARIAVSKGYDAADELKPDAAEAKEFKDANHVEEPWTKFAHDYGTLVLADADAERQGRAKLIKELEYANTIKHEMLAFVNAAIGDPCTELVNLRGPIEVNGVPQGSSQLTVSIHCAKGISKVDLAIPDVVWTNVDAGKDSTKTVDGGALLVVNANGAKTASVTAEGNPDFASGDQVVGDIIPIAGDSGPPIDEVM